MRHLISILLLGVLACDGSTPIEPVEEETWHLSVTRALPDVPSAFSVQAFGSIIVLRTADGLWRSRDGGETFASWTNQRTVDVLPMSDGSSWQLRNRGEFGSEDLVFEHVSDAGVATTVPIEVTWGAGSRWVSGSFHRGETKHYLQVFGRLDDVTLAPSKLFEIDPTTRAVTEVALPREVASGSVWMVAQSGTTLAVATFDEDVTFMAIRDGSSWIEVPNSAGLIDLIASDGAAFIASRVVDGTASLERLELDGDANVVARSTPVSAAFSLARGRDGKTFAVSRTFINPFSESGKILLESRDGGRTWETLATALEATSAFDSRISVASTGLWTIDGPFVTWRPSDGRHWRLAGLSSEIATPFLQARDDEIWMVTYRDTALLTPDGGNHLFRSADRGVTWHYSGGVGVAVNCFALAPTFLFFAGPGDVRGALYETRDLTGRNVIRNDRIVLAEGASGGELDVVACASSGGTSITVSQAPVGNLPGLMHGVNLQHQTSDEAILWQTGRQVPDHRFTALDGVGPNLKPITGAAERYFLGPGGLQPEPYTFFYDDGISDWVFTLDITRPQRGARSAVRVHGGVMVYPTGELYLDYKAPDTIEGLDEAFGHNAFIRDAFLDAHGVLWVGTDRGLFRDQTPVPPPAPDGCDVDRDCPGFGTGGDLCRATTRCIDQQCVPQPAVSCAGRPIPAPCRKWECVPATGECEEAVADDFSTCGRVDACHEWSICQFGACVEGAPIVCEGGTECAPAACDPATGCFKDYLPAGALCGVVDACDLAGRCTGRFDDCVGATERTCDDGNPCTQDACDAVRGCVFTPTRQGLGCDDGNACTANDICDAGVCLGTTANEGGACDDGEECTADTTCEAGVCSGGIAVVGSCDGDPCTTGGVCEDRACVATSLVVCADDQNPCTSDACVPGRGCVYAPVSDGEGCEHGDTCQEAGICQAGWCVGGEALSDGTACSNGRSCVAGEVCQEGRCGGGQIASTGACDDGYACTTADRCDGGFCVGNVSSSTCEGIPVCANCVAPVGPALIVTWASTNLRKSGVIFLTLGGAFISKIEIPGVGMLYGVVHDRVHGDGFWVTSDVTSAERAIWKVGWDGAVLEKRAIVGGPANQDFVGGLDHVPARDGLPEVLVIKSGSSIRRLTIIDRQNGAFLSQLDGRGTGQAIWVESFAATVATPDGRPIWWTGDFVATRQILNRVEDNTLTWVQPFPLGDAISGITREAGGGAFWLATHQFDSQIVRLAPDGRRTHAFEMPWAGAGVGGGGGPGSPRVFDIDLWPGSATF